KSCIISMALFVLLPQLSVTQNVRPLPVYPLPPVDMSISADSMPPPMQRRLQQELVRERQLALKRDTDQLLDMATELKQNVDGTSPAILSLDVIRKAEKIEKLAKSIREKMKGN